MRSLILFLFCSLLTLTLDAENEQQQFDAANQLYIQGKYAEAAQQYETLLTAGFRSADLYFNLGNSYYKQEGYGRAVLNFERALLMNPRDKDIQHNLGEVKKRLKDDIEQLPTFFLAKWWNGLRQSASLGTWSILSILLLWLAAGSFLLWLKGKERKHKKRGFLVGFTSLLLGLLAVALASHQASLNKDSHQAVILEKSIELRSAPDEESTSLLTLHEGTKVDLLDQIGEWYKINLANGDQGWLPFEVLEKI